MPKALKRAPQPEIEASPALSLFARPGDGRIVTRRIAILVADGVDAGFATALHTELTRAGAVPRFVGVRLGAVTGKDGDAIDVEVTFETMPSVLFDAMAVPDGKECATLLGNVGQAVEFIKDQYRHAKPMLALGAGADLIENAGVPGALPSGAPDPGVLVERQGTFKGVIPKFIAAIARHRHHEREMDPPPV